MGEEGKCPLPDKPCLLFLRYYLTMKTTEFIYGAARILAALLMIQTLYFKFTASPESIFIFTTVGMEPWGRVGVGIFELVASVLLLWNRMAWVGAALALGLMAGALFMHFTLLGIEVQGDGGQLFIYALIVTGASAFVLYRNKETIERIIRKIKS